MSAYDYDENDFESPMASISGDGLEHLLTACEELKGHADEGAQDIHTAVVEALGELESLGMSACAVEKEDSHFVHIDDDEDLEEFVNQAIERRKDEGLDVRAAYAAVSSEGHVLLIDEHDLTQSTVVRFNGALN